MARMTSGRDRVRIQELAQQRHTDRQIAAELGWCVATVRKWRRRVRQKGRLGLASRMGRPRTGALGSYPARIRETLRCWNGGNTFTVPAHERLDTVYWAERKGVGQAYNSVVAATTESVIVFLHNDCLVPEKPWIRELTATAEKYGFAFPAVETDVEDSVARGVAAPVEGFPPSCCYAVSREAWNKLGGFDPVYEGCHFEDTDMFMRAVLAGYRMAQVPDVTVYHRRGVTRSMTAEESNTAYQRNKQIYLDRWQQGEYAPLPSLEEIHG